MGDRCVTLRCHSVFTYHDWYLS